jgi:hypothetical protein
LAMVEVLRASPALSASSTTTSVLIPPRSFTHPMIIVPFRNAQILSTQLDHSLLRP